MRRYLQGLLLLLLLGSTCTLYFEEGFDHHYTYSSESDILGLHNITTIVKFRIRLVNSTTDGDSLNMLFVDSFVQHSEKGYFADNPLKWNLNRMFLFSTGPDGLVTMVHHHPEDKYEVLSLKKVLASTLSAKVKAQTEPSWTFKSEELDHTGELEHEYNGEKTSTGVKIVRSHQSVSNVHRSHNKTMHLDHRGTPVHVEAVDNVTLHSRDAPSIKRTPLEGEAKIIDVQSGPFPKIGTVSKSKTKLTAKSAHNEIFHHTLTNLTRDSVFVKQKELKRLPLESLESEIMKTIACVHQYSNKFDKNRTDCVNILRDLFLTLHQKDFLQLAEKYIVRRCQENDTICVDERNLFIDMLGSEGSQEAQTMLLDLVITQPSATEEDIRRCLMHCITFKEPLQKLVDIVEKMCHKGIEYIKDIPSLTRNGKRACLSLGAMAKSLHGINQTESDRIVERLEKWLEQHNQTKTSELVNIRQPRSVLEYDRQSRKHIETKMILLQSLGNAGKQRSLDHIKSYLGSDVDVSVWRRVAVHSLRHFTCDESALALIHAAVHDENEVVRQTAVKVFEKHPKSNNITREHENIVLSKNYTYEAVARVRRDFLDLMWEGIEYKLKVPGFEWEKTIGTEDVGASMGLIIRNILDIKLNIQSGHFMIDVYDGAYAYANIGLLDLQIDIVKAYVCFKGHISYELNILKDFGINSKQDMVNLYDNIIGKIVNPVKSGVGNFNEILELFRDGSIVDLFQNMLTTMTKLPSAIGNTTRWLKVLLKVILKTKPSTMVESVKNLLQQFKQMFSEIKLQIGNFYSTVADAITSDLPYAGKRLKEAFVLIVEGFKNVIDTPVQAFSIMRRGGTHLTTAVAMFADAINKIADAILGLGGRVNEWLNLGSSTVGTFLEKVKAAIMNVLDPGRAADGTLTPRREDFLRIASNTENIWNEMMGHVEELKTLGRPFINAFKSVADLIKGIKWGFHLLMKVLDKSAGLILKLFGPKFHPDFPNERRGATGGCPPGVWATTTDDHYKTLGVDLKLDAGKPIPAPVDGILHVDGGTRVVIKPTEKQFEGTEIILENINPVSEADGKRFSPGDEIGSASKIDLCGDNFIHLSVRETKNGTFPDDDFDYIDPSGLLDDFNPLSKWVQECMDYEFRLLGQTFDSGESEDGGESKIDKLQRAFEDKVGSSEALSGIFDTVKSIIKRETEESNPVLTALTNFKDSFVERITSRPAEFFLNVTQALFAEDGPSIPRILDILDLNSMSVGSLLDSLKGESEFANTLITLAQSLVDGMRELPAEHPLALPVSFLKRFLGSNDNSSGSVDDLATQVIGSAEEKCFQFDGGIVPNLGHLCVAHCNCLGVNCSVALQIGDLMEFIQVGVSFNMDNEHVEIHHDGLKFIVIPDGEEHLMELDYKSSDMIHVAVLVGQMYQDNDSFVFSLQAKMCEDGEDSCEPSTEVLSGIRFLMTQPSDSLIDESRCTVDGHTVGKGDLLTEILAMSIPVFINSLGDYDKLNDGAMDMFGAIREIIITQLMKQPADRAGAISAEFHDKFDLCLSFNASVPPFEIEFFRVQFNFLIGPVPLSLGFGGGGALGFGARIAFCVLSLKARVTLVPEVGGKVYGDAAVDLGFARGGIRMIGYLLETQFPITIELIFAKYPLDLGCRMDMLLVPLRLVLRAFVELNLFIKTITIFEGTIFEYSLPLINKNIFNIHSLDKDISPPELLPRTINLHDDFGPNTFPRQKREETQSCLVQQALGRAYYDPAFRLELHAEDPVSDVKLSYAIGTHSGGTDVEDWTEMGGYSLLEPAILPGGIPLYWTVKATNSEGLDATAQCSLDTYDGTLPDGRVEHSYKFSSHPTKLSASVIVSEDSPLADTHYKAVGYTQGQHGSQLINWEKLDLDKSVYRMDATGYLRMFTVPRKGKLTAQIMNSQVIPSPEECAELCITTGGQCISFDYETHSRTCDLHKVVEGAKAYLRVSGTYYNYERLGSGYRTPIEYSDLTLEHGTVYFINAKVKNVLGYEAFLFGDGTMVDFTCPEPGPVGEVYQDILRADGCSAAITQTCHDITWRENHRIIIDGPGAGTVFSGHKPLVDELYTLTNHYVSANWYGFHDDESGIMGFTWAVGQQICGTDILDYNDPHDHLPSRSSWTNIGFEKGFHLVDGPYYISVQALNNAELGGSLVTTVCHSIPFHVDTSPPVFSGVTEIIYDEDFDMIAIYYEASDDLSHIAKTEFGLGKTKYDVQLRAYTLHSAMDRDDPFVALEDLGLQEGVPAWIRIRVTNHVDLFTTGHGEEPILIDKSRPIAGEVLDGNQVQIDMVYQSDGERICAHWVNFYDPESGIDRFEWGVGTYPGEDEVVPFKTLTKYDKSACAYVTLEHNTTYYSTVTAFNNAINPKFASNTSNGVLVDMTEPIPGYVVDGQASDEEDMRYTSETATKTCHWDGYSDPESGIQNYLVKVYVNTALEGTFDVGQNKQFEDKTISLEHSDHIVFSVHGINGAGLSTAVESNGFIVDHTPPIMLEVSVSEDDVPYQSYNDVLHLRWNFRDEESGIQEYRTLIYETKHGQKQKIWPSVDPYNVSVPVSTFSGLMQVVLDGLVLQDGGKYSLHVTSQNGALMTTAHESIGIIVDTTPPNAPKVHIGLLSEDEDLDENGRILHSDQHGIRVSWSGRDSESGIQLFLVAIGTSDNPESLLAFSNYGTLTTAYINNIYFETTLDSNTTYIVSVQAVNGAGLSSPFGRSKPIFVQKANVAGIVFDGRTLYEDETYTYDQTSLAASFYGFESESCNINSYEWAVGTEPYGTDIFTYTNYGLVMENETHGYMQIHEGFSENTKYFVSVRAVTGCMDEIIVSSSNGIIVDTSPPTITFRDTIDNDTVILLNKGVWYQDSVDSIGITADVMEEHELNSVEWALGIVPFSSDLHIHTSELTHITNAILLDAGESNYITAFVTDKAGNTNNVHSPAIIGDLSPPVILNIQCTQYISVSKGLVSCYWDTLIEDESKIRDIFISIGVQPQLGNILLEYEQPLTKRDFSYEVSDFTNEYSNYTTFYVDFKTVNIIGRTNEYEKEVVVDHSSPQIMSVNVVTRTNGHEPYTPKQCQLPTSFVEIQVDGIEDPESDIDNSRHVPDGFQYTFRTQDIENTRLQVAFGSKAFGSDITEYATANLQRNNIILIDDIEIQTGKVFYGTVRVYNKAGLYTEMSSNPVVVSQSPVLKIIDGDLDQDIDFQSDPNIIQGHWEYSDDCPVIEAKWKVHDLIGNVIRDYEIIPDAASAFFDDEVDLAVGVKYFVTVMIIDALNRTKISQSDGVSVRIQPPLIGSVRDGLGEDINFQRSISELSANWEAFGDISGDPTQAVQYYEVAISNDPRYSSTLSNIHYFVNVGMNTSYTFTNLNLTAKNVTYYIIVRCYSIAGGISESYSNGIRVGYSDIIIPGTIESRPFQFSTDTIPLSWSGFYSDFGITRYFVGISSQLNVTNSSFPCVFFKSDKSVFDVKVLEDAALNTYSLLQNLNLSHGVSYFPVVIADDAAGACSAVVGQQIKVDNTAPTVGSIYINDLKADQLVFAKDKSEIHVRWSSFEDIESGIKTIKTTLLDCSACDSNLSEICFTIEESQYENDTNSNFYGLNLLPKTNYRVRLTVINNAGLSAIKQSHTILLDESSPNTGDVKITDNWKISKDFQSDNSTINGKMAIALSEQAYIFSNQINYFPSSNLSNWDLFDDTFSNEFITIGPSGAFLGMGYRQDLSTVIKSGITSPILGLENGNFSFTLQAASGLNAVTTVALSSSKRVIPFLLNDKPKDTVFTDTGFNNSTTTSTVLNLSPNIKSNAGNETTTTTGPPTTDALMSNTSSETNTYLMEEEFGIGFHILGYKIADNIQYYGLMWAKNEFANVERWFGLNFDPTKTQHMFSISVHQHISYEEEMTDISLFADDKEVVIINNLQIGKQVQMSILTWNEDGYKAPIDDVYDPYYAEAFIKSIDIPSDNRTECLNGRPFFDSESGIKEVWTGVADSETVFDNISPFQLLYRFCPPCFQICNSSCSEEQCTYQNIDEEYMILDINATNLQLRENILDKKCFNVSHEDSCNSSSYYLTTKVVNFAGQTTFAHSNGIQLDMTPPTCEYVKCLDPDNSADEPTEYLGSNSTIGAYWNCSEDLGIISYFEVSVASVDGQEIILNATNVGTVRRITLDLGENMFTDKQSYMLQVTAMNNAGLSQSYSCSVEVALLPPNVSTTVTQPLYAPLSPVGEDLVVSNSSDEIGISWEKGSDQIEFYEWQLGTQCESADIFPPVKVGINSSGSVAIVKGKLEVNSIETDKAVSEFHEQVINTAGDIDSGANKTFRDDNFFQMEPGRCVCQSLSAIGYSHLKTKVTSNTVCVKRPHDIVVDTSSGISSHVLTKPVGSNIWSNSPDPAAEIVISTDLNSGTLMAGSLEVEDKTTPYGTAASSNFVPFISDPTLTGQNTSRILQNRVKAFCDVSFYISPAPVFDYNSIDIDITIPDICKNDPSVEPALISWNPVDELWQPIDEDCLSNGTAKGTNNVYTASVCSKSTNASQNIVRRSTGTVFASPTHFELVTVTKTFINQPPIITTDEISADEDTPVSLQIETFDAEGDELKFEIVANPQHATCLISSTGLLKCTLEQDFFGDDQITINVTETGLPSTEQTNSVEKVIAIRVIPVSDPVDRYFIEPNGKISSEVRPSMKKTFQTDSNSSTSYIAGTIVLGSIDDGDVFTFDGHVTFTSLGQSSFTINEISVSEISTNLTVSQYRTLHAYKVTFTYSPLDSGKMTLYFIAVRADGTYTPSITIDMYILSHPCIYGYCSHITHGIAGCDNLVRATTFNSFICICDEGFTGQWCQTEINECFSDACGTLFDCVDQINSYTCAINIPKVVAIVVCPLLVIGVAVFVLIRLWKRYKEKRKQDGQRRILLVSESQPDQEPPPFIRQPMLREYTDNEIPPFSFFTMSKSEKPPLLVGGSWLKHTIAQRKEANGETVISQSTVIAFKSESPELPESPQGFANPALEEDFDDTEKDHDQHNSDVSDLENATMSEEEVSDDSDVFVAPPPTVPVSLHVQGSSRPAMSLSTILGNDNKESLSDYLTRQGKAKARNTNQSDKCNDQGKEVNLASLKRFGSVEKGQSHFLRELAKKVKQSKKTNSDKVLSSEKATGIRSKSIPKELKTKKNRSPTRQRKKKTIHPKKKEVKPKGKTISVSEFGTSDKQEQELHLPSRIQLDRSASIASNGSTDRPPSQMTDIEA